MPKITRATQKIFAQNGTDQLAAFGSMKTGTPIYTDNIEDLQTSDYEDGWENAIVADEAPFLEEMNGVQYGFSKQLAYLFQEGIAEYDAETTYYKNSIVKGVNSDGVMTLWYSLTDNNIGNNPADDTTEINWKVLDLGGGSTGSGTGLQLFDLVQKDHILTEEESVGFAQLGTYVYKEAVPGSRYGYPDFYSECVSEKTAGTQTQTTLGDSTITTYNNANGHIFYDIADKAAVDAYYESTGIAWFYGVDTANERIFLPRGKNYTAYGNTANTVPVIGNGMTLGLTDGTNNYGLMETNDWGASIDKNSYGTSIPSTAGYTTTAANGARIGVTTDPTKSGIVAQTSDLIKGKEAYLYMVVGNTEFESAATDIVDITTSENDTIPLFAPWYFDFEPNSVAWLKAGQQANSGSVYTTAYNTLVNELTTPTLGLKVIDVDDMVADTDYSLYWKVDQTAMTFTTPTKSELRPMGETAAVIGNGMTLGLTNGEQNVGLRNANVGGPSNTYVAFDLNYYGKDTGYNGTLSGNVTTDGAFGVTSDSTKSGLIAQNTSTAQLYFKVANAVQNLQLLDAGEITEALADKIGTTECKAYVTETYSNGSSWYRVWSDGWCEQGGRLSVTSNQTVTITFAKSFIDTNYTAFKNMGCNSTGAGAAREYSLWNFTQTSMQTQVNTNHYWTSWIAQGYIS